MSLSNNTSTAAHDALASIGWTSYADRIAATTGEAPLQTAHCRIVERHRDRFVVHDGHQLHTVQAANSQLRLGPEAAIVGDWALLTFQGEERWLESVLPRFNLLSRARDAGGQQALLANVDTVLLVMGLDGNYNITRLQRLLALVRGAPAQPVILLSKADRCEVAAERCANLREVLPDVTVMAADVHHDDIERDLAPWIGPGQTLALLGSSGVGKSTLCNRLLRSAEQRTGEVGEGDRGRHTTVTRRLLALAGGACVIDTPGLREVAMHAEADAAEGFIGITQHAPNCRFSDCQHRAEPGCAVRDAVPAEELERWHKLASEQARHQRTALERQQARVADKGVHKEQKRSYKRED